MAALIIDDEGVSHLPGDFLIGHETLCGNVDMGFEYRHSVGVPNCNGCISAAKSVLAVATPKEIKGWSVKAG